MVEILMLIALYGMCHFFFKNSAIGELSEMKWIYQEKPNRYLKTPRWIKKHFRVKNEFIPKYICFRLCVSVFSLMMIPISALICLITKLDSIAVGIMVFVPCAYVIPDTLVYALYCRVFWK